MSENTSPEKMTFGLRLAVIAVSACLAFLPVQILRSMYYGHVGYSYPTYSPGYMENLAYRDKIMSFTGDMLFGTIAIGFIILVIVNLCGGLKSPTK